MEYTQDMHDICNQFGFNVFEPSLYNMMSMDEKKVMVIALKKRISKKENQSICDFIELIENQIIKETSKINDRICELILNPLLDSNRFSEQQIILIENQIDKVLSDIQLV